MLVDLARMEHMQFDVCPAFVIDPERQYTATLETNRGEIILLLDAKAAPLAVNNFVFLARQGWYDGSPFHRVLPGQFAQSGDPSGTGLGGPGYAFPDEIGALRFDQPGRVAMAGAGPNGNGSQFFITYAALPDLDGQYTIFGSVLQGMDVLQALSARDPSQMGDLPDSDTIQRILIEERVVQ
jgi:cyclophilin family peptidyl-prolyl cis-trans isomerase